ncbi:MAG: rnpA [Parcubacteria group bacterium]|nr:rnpA [Parcubacteria group bacterium]
MLPKDKRLPRELFTELLERSKYANSLHFSLRYVLGSSTRVGVSVSKKISKKAVVRNRTRRRVYFAVQSLDLPSGLLLFVAKKGAETLKGEVLHKELQNLLGSVR